ncbi:MAG: Dihydrokaempferol 4-reductase [Bacteroidetes bacterium]|nr:Dihydrokaempferol 4-reductase [Bacteroidota bacterium]
MSPETRILVTGAGGFIGGWVVETLYLNGFKNVRCGIRRWSTAARIGRFPIEIVLCDVANTEQVKAAVKDIDIVIHCAYGSQDSTIKGTGVLLEAAKKQNVKRLIHLSTIDVYGGIEGEVGEDSPLLATGSDYGDSKIEAENLCWSHAKQGFPVVILRPTIVYGPYSKLWISKFAERLGSGKWGIFKETGDGICNFVYVQDLIQAIFRSLKSDRAVGQAFNINGADMITWNEFFRRFNTALNLPPLREIEPGKARLRSKIMSPIKSTARYFVDNFGDTITNIYKRSELARRVMKQAESNMKVSPGPQELKMFGLDVHYKISKAESLLGYKPTYDVETGIAMSVQWLQHEAMFSHTISRQ